MAKVAVVMGSESDFDVVKKPLKSLIHLVWRALSAL